MQNKLDLAEKYYLMAIKYNNNYSNALYNLGYLYAKQNKLDLAEEYYLMAINNGTNDFYAMNNLGLLYHKQLKLDSAEKYFLMAIEYGSKMASYNLGYLYEEQHKFDLALKYYLQAILFDAETIQNIVRLIPILDREQQLEILESVGQIRTIYEYYMALPIDVRKLFVDKQAEMTKCLSNYLINDLVNICVSYY